jgi:protein SCO1
MRLLRLFFALALAAGVGGAWAQGQAPSDKRSLFDPSVLKIDETRYLGKPLDAALPLLDAQGRAFTLGDLRGKPAILVLSYYGCDGSCPTVNRNLAAALPGVKRFALGRDYHVLTVSFDRHDTPARAAEFLRGSAGQILHGLPDGTGWRFAVLRDVDANQPKAFADGLGFRFFWSDADKTFLHPNLLVFLTPDGRVARYLYGSNADARTIELALIDADWGRISESAAAAFDMLTGACYSYSFADGRYHPNYALLAGVGSFLFGIAVMALGAFSYRRKLARRLVHAP